MTPEWTVRAKQNNGGIIVGLDEANIRNNFRVRVNEIQMVLLA